MVRLTVRQSGTPEVGLVYIGTTHAAIQAAIDYANSKGGGTIFIEHGIYEIETALKIYSNIKICGEYFGTVLKPSGSNNVISCTGTAGAELENITIEALLIGNDDKTVAVGEHGIYASYCGKAQTTGLPNGGYDASTVGKDKINKIGVIIKDCWLQGNRLEGILLSNSDNCKAIENVAFYNSNGAVRTNFCKNALIANNIAQNALWGIAIHNTNNSILSGNIVQNSTAGITLHDNSQNNAVIGNTAQNCGNESSGSAGAGIGLYANNNSIVGNTVQNIFGDGIASRKGNNHTITGNTVQNNKFIGIRLTDSHNNAITGNTCQNNTGGGIKLETSNKNTITGNKYQSISITGTGNLNSAAHNQQVT